jgi:hypothetical protein
MPGGWQQIPVTAVVLRILAIGPVQLATSIQPDCPIATLPARWKMPQVTILQALATAPSVAIARSLDFWNGACVRFSHDELSEFSRIPLPRLV